jgi:hypothetical protein
MKVGESQKSPQMSNLRKIGLNNIKKVVALPPLLGKGTRRSLFFIGAPCMVDNLVVKVHYGGL